MLNRSHVLAFGLGFLCPLAALAAFAFVRFEATYTDASGSDCIAFALSEEREIDTCSGLYDRIALMPPALPIAINPPASEVRP